MQSAVVVLSGGMDSSVLLADILHQKMDTVKTVVTFDYGAKHNQREKEAAKAIVHWTRLKYSAKYEHWEIDLRNLAKALKSALTDPDWKIPEGHYEDESMRQTVVPFRNGILLSIAGGIAETVGAKHLYYGAHVGDHAIYPDCRKEWVGAFRETLRLGTYGHILLCAPFINATKRDIGLLGYELEVPFELTYSCYNGQQLHCGKCGTCTERKEALAGFDPTSYSS